MPYGAACCVKCAFSAVSKAPPRTSTRRAYASSRPHTRHSLALSLARVPTTRHTPTRPPSLASLSVIISFSLCVVVSMGVVVVMVVTDLQRDTRTHTRTTHRRAAADEGVFAVVAVCGLRVIEDFTPAARTYTRISLVLPWVVKSPHFRLTFGCRPGACISRSHRFVACSSASAAADHARSTSASVTVACAPRCAGRWPLPQRSPLADGWPRN